MQQIRHVKKRATKSQFNSCIDRISDINNIIYVKCVDPGGRLSGLRHR